MSYLLYKINREQLISLYDECKLRGIEDKNTDNEIISFVNYYYYKSLKGGQLLRNKSPSSLCLKKKNLKVNHLKKMKKEKKYEIDKKEKSFIC